MHIVDDYYTVQMRVFNAVHRAVASMAQKPTPAVMEEKPCLALQNNG